MAGIGDIAAERQRQVEGEGWTPKHDDQHPNGELVFAAVAYAAPEPVYRKRGDDLQVTYRDSFPWEWDPKWDKRDKHDRRRQLLIAGALIVAEIDRIDRAAHKEAAYRRAQEAAWRRSL